MSKRYILFMSIAMALSVGITASAASIFDITFPIAELGNCANREECKTYCDDLSHADACNTFAQAHGIGNAQSVKQAAALADTGPGGCKTAQECKTYCDDTAHFDECISFAEAHGLMSKKEIQQARKPINKGPGGCKTQEECKSYCSDQDHQLECAGFARELGQISDSDYNAIKQVSTSGGPGGCKDHQECQNYCKDATHLEECLSFAEEHGFVSHDNAAVIRKAGVAGPGPGGCQGNDACRQYCTSADHQEECLDFGETHGLINKEEASTARKLIGKTGPGGCQGKDECQSYCSDPSHTEECIASAQENGLISPQAATQARAFIQTVQQGGPGGCKSQQDCQSYCQDPAHREECFDFAKRRKLISSDDEKQMQAGLQIQKTVQQNGGPGGCTNDQECKSYCSDPGHTEECIAFAAAHGGISEDRARAMLQQFTTQRASAQGDVTADTLEQSQQDSTARFEEFKQLERQFRPLGGHGTGFNQEQRGGGFNPPPGSIPGQKPVEGGPASAQTTGGPSGFVGPGGCTGATQCISYCAEHKDECFNQAPEDNGQPGQPDNQGNQGSGGTEFSRSRGQKEGVPFQSGGPQLRMNIVHELKSEDLPQNFEQRSSEEKRQFFKEKFQQFQQNEGAGLPGTSPQGFPGRQNPGQNFGRPESNEDNGQQDDASNRFRGIAPEQGTRGIFAPFEGKQEQNPSGEFPSGSSGREGQPPFIQKDFNGQQPPTQGNFGTQQKQFSPSGIPGQQMPLGEFYPKQGEGYPTQPGGQFPVPSQPSGYPQFPSGGTGGLVPSPGSYPQQIPPGSTGGYPSTSGYPQFPTGSTGSYPPPPSGTTGTYQPPTGTGGTYVPPPSGTSVSYPPPPSGTDGSMSPPSSGSTGGTYQPPPPPSGFGPLNAYFAALLQTLFTR